MPHMRRMDIIMTRTAGLAHLAEIMPRLGRSYAATRNTDRGVGHRATTSVLSPYLRHRLLTEQEVVAAAQENHGEGASKFVEEVFWRTYFKGYLETRPGIWDDYGRRVAEGRARVAANSGLRRVYEDAIAGRTGIDGFDDWARDIVAQNWLHNHARMWFASIWIFTLKLPWALGADFFMQHLLDGDPASNTLSWRWVAGLHTRGKNYAARAENIRRYTDGRYDPHGLDEDPVALDEPEPAPARPMPATGGAPTGDVALLLHVDDLHPESLAMAGARVMRVAGYVAHHDSASGPVRAADQAAMDDALARAAQHFGCDAAPASPGWEGGLPVVAAWAPVGPSAAALPECLRVRRRWDGLVWPKSTRGYFQVKAIIPKVMAAGADFHGGPQLGARNDTQAMMG